jgi:hypothetical protein
MDYFIVSLLLHGPDIPGPGGIKTIQIWAGLGGAPDRRLSRAPRAGERAGQAVAGTDSPHLRRGQIKGEAPGSSERAETMEFWANQLRPRGFGACGSERAKRRGSAGDSDVDRFGGTSGAGQRVLAGGWSKDATGGVKV